jgi:hypothetical protein
MKLPNRDLAEVPENKITQYLLNPAHPAGGSKAAFFLQFGFTVVAWGRFADAIRGHAESNEVVAVTPCSYGTRFVVDGPLIAPDGRRLNTRCAWFIENGTEIPPFCDCAPSSQMMKPINELDVVALTCELNAQGLVPGDVGTVVLVHGGGAAFEVEFVGYDGHTVALVTLERDQVRTLEAGDIPQARGLSAV